MAYFANSTEGAIFDKQCDNCKLNNKSCPVANIQLEYNYTQVGNGLAKEIMNELVNKEGVCQIFYVYNELLNNTKKEILKPTTDNCLHPAYALFGCPFDGVCDNCRFNKK